MDGALLKVDALLVVDAPALVAQTHEVKRLLAVVGLVGGVDVGLREHEQRRSRRVEEELRARGAEEGAPCDRFRGSPHESAGVGVEREHLHRGGGTLGLGDVGGDALAGDGKCAEALDAQPGVDLRPLGVLPRERGRAQHMDLVRHRTECEGVVRAELKHGPRLLRC